MFPPFVGPFKLVERSRQQAAELAKAVESYGDVKGTFIDISQPESHLRSYVFHIDATAPIEWAILLRESINSLRVALDIVVTDAARALGHPASKMSDVKFPFGKDEDGLQKAFKRMKLPQQLEGVLNSIHPVRSPQNRWIRDLHDIDILSKHRTILPVFAVVPTTMHLPPPLTDFFKEAGIGLSGGMSVLWRSGSMLHLQPDVDPRASIPAGCKLDIAMPNELPFGEHSVSSLLRVLADSTFNIVAILTDLFDPNAHPTSKAQVRALFKLP